MAESRELEPQATATKADAELGQDFSFFSLLKYALPTIFALVFISIYQTVDGIFIEQFTPDDLAIAAVNLYSPILYLFIAFGLMMGSGGNAMIVRLLGEKRKEDADRVLSATVIFSLAGSLAITALCLIFEEPIMRFLGASDVTVAYLRPYYTILTAGGFSIVFQTSAGSLLIGEGKSVTAAVLLVIGGVLNCVLDWLFMAPLNMGIFGAGLATVIGYLPPVFYAIYFYGFGHKSVYRFRIGRIRFREIGQVMFNGSSDMVTNLAAAVTALLMNQVIKKYAGDTGVGALSAVLYFQFIVIAVFMGFTMAVEPLFSYHYGTGNREMRGRLFRYSMSWSALIAVVLSGAAFLLREPIIACFFNKGTEIYDLALRGLTIMIPGGLFVGLNTFASGLFTAFSNGAVSGFLSILRSVVFLIAAIFGMSALFGADGLWASWPVAELASLLVSAVALWLYRNKYGYSRQKPSR